MSAQTNVPPPEQASSAGGAWEYRPGSPADRLPPPEHPSDALREGLHKLAEIREFAAYYLAARLDGLKASLRNAGVYAALGVMGLAAGAALIGTAAVLLLWGIAGAFAALLGG